MANLTKVKDFLEKPSVLFAFRLLISGLLLFILFRLSVVENIASVFTRLDPVYLLAFYSLYFLGVGLQVLRWKYLLGAWDLHLGFGLLWKWSMTGLFLNNFLPGTLGGDAFRLYSSSRHAGRMEDIAATIFYERILGYGSLVTLGVISLAIRANYADDRLFWWLLGTIFLAIAVVLAFLTLPGFGRRVDDIMERSVLVQKTRLKDWFNSFRFKVHHPGNLVGVFLISFLIQFADVFAFLLVARSIRLPVQLSDLFLFVPLLYLAVLAPFSVNGIGIRETVFVFFASWWGISQSEAVAFSLTVFTLNVAGSLVGGPIYWIDRRRAEKGNAKLKISS